MTELAMFPLGTVLFPSMPALLRVFEERYLTMLGAILQDEPAEFGIVLIERGAEVGGNDRRFDIGTVAQVTQLMEGDGFVGLAATGARRFAVDRWLDDDPYPRAEITFLPELTWQEELRPLLDEAERAVRRGLAQGSEYEEQRWSADVELSDDPVQAAWQLAGVAPIGELDQVSLLRSDDIETLLRSTIDLTAGAVEALTANWSDLTFPPDEDGSSDNP
jgi:Lon protease-like protein